MAELDRLCFVTISRFYRDRKVWEALRDEVLPAQAKSAEIEYEERFRVLCIGAASGEEPYTLSMLWALELAGRYPRLSLDIVATDVDERVLERARVAVYDAGSLRELPRSLLEAAFQPEDGAYRLRERFRAAVELRREDVRDTLPRGPFRIVFCRNSIFTYFDEALQQETLERLLAVLAPGGAFVAAPHEKLPPSAPLVPWFPELGIFRRA